MLTLKRFLSIITEDANLDKMVMDIQTAIGQIDTQINQRTQPLLTQKQQLQRRLVPLLRKKQDEDKRNQVQTQQDNQMNAGSNQTTTPGSSGAATPGSTNSNTPI